MKKRFLMLPAVAAMLLTGCVNFAPSYEQPAAPVAQAWPADEATRHAQLLTEGLMQWDAFFTDDRLKKVIEQGLSNNRNLRAAALNVERARALYRVSEANLLPTVAASASGTAARTFSNGHLVHAKSYTASVAMASYELDFFGRVRNANEQALQAYMQTQAAQRTAQMTVITEIAQTWLGLGAAKEQKKLAAETLASQKESLRLIEESYRLGASSLIDVKQASTTVASARAAYAQAVRAESQYRNALALLAGGTLDPALEPDGLMSSVTIGASLPAGLPSEVLLNRPDIAAAEAALRSANANIGIARAAYFPRIALTTSVGTTAGDVGGLFEGANRIWSFAPQISVPIFTGGATKANLEAAKLQQQAAIASYEGAIQSAFREVADALAVTGTVNEELEARRELAQATAETYRLAQARYKNGVDSYLSVLDSQRADFSARLAVISAELNRAASSVTLYKVLGGGSQLTTSQPKDR